MKIGIDIDGVITDMDLWFKAYKMTVKDLGGKAVDAELLKYFFKDGMMQKTLSNLLWGVTEEEYRQHLSSNLYKYYTCQKPRAGMVELLHNLRRAGNEVVIVTARIDGSYESQYVMKRHKGTFKDFTRHYLEKNGIEFDNYYYGVGDKSKVVEAEHIDVMVDDYIKNLRAIGNKVPTCRLIHYKHKYNEDESDTALKIEPVHTMEELAALLK